MKKGIIILVLVSFWIFSTRPLIAKNDSGLGLLLLGDSAAALGRGGTGVAAFGADLFYLNPASLAGSDRVELGLQYGTLDDRFFNPDVTLAIPNSYGVLGASLRMVRLPSSAPDIGNGIMASLGSARDITDSFFAGAALHYARTAAAAGKQYYAGASLGSIYRIGVSRSLGAGWGLWEPSLGLSARLGLARGDYPDAAGFNEATAGYTFLFFRGPSVSAGFFNDITAMNKFRDYPVKAGIESLLFNAWIVRAGFIYPQTYGYGDATLGLGYRFGLRGFEGELNYALVHYSGSRFTHYAGLNMKFGEPDREAPETEVVPDQKYISPNYDGRQDFVVFTTSVRDRSRIRGWSLQILNPDGRVIREYRLSGRDVEEGLSLSGFLRAIFRRKESLVVPERILWDGTDEQGKIAPDGRYRYTFIAWDERDNISVSKAGLVYVDTTTPEAELKADDLLFSPNGDRHKDELLVRQKVKCSPEDEWSAGFTDGAGKVVRSYRWTGSAVPDKLLWDGRDDGGNEVMEGLYGYFIESTDRAGNGVRKTVRGISLTRHYEVADVSASLEYFSFKNQTGIRFFPMLSKAEGLESWTITIEDAGRKAVREITGKQELPRFLDWDVRDAKGKALPDGRYFYRLNTVFRSGNIPASFSKEFTLDSAPPDISLTFSPSLFSPDRDGMNDELTLYPSARDPFGVRDWKITIFSPSGYIFKSFGGASVPAGEIKWDGIGESGELVESAVDYAMELTATDFAGNVARSGKIPLPVDVLVMVTGRGLKIRISNIEFGFDSAKLTPKGHPVLDRVADILGRYRLYDVLIEGHTDDVGEEEYNLRLSEGRAKAVMDYLVSRGVDRQRLTFRGMGESAAYVPNTDDENRRKNRRVEFLLIRKEKPD